MAKLKIAFSYLVSFLLLIGAITFSLKYLWSVYSYANKNFRTESVYLTRGDTTQNFYTAYIPDKKKPVGMLVLNYVSLTPAGFQLASENRLVVICATPSVDYLSTLVEDSILITIDNLIADAVNRYNIPKEKIIIGGLSAGGTAAIRYAQFCKSGRSENGLVPAGVFAADPPVDYERLWGECRHAVDRNIYEVASQSGQWVMNYMTDKIGARCEENPQQYRSISPFDYKEKNGGRAVLLKEMPIRLYVEPDVNWYIENRAKDYYDMNAVDCAGMINRLRILGNKRAELILTKDKGYNPDGTRNPHSWTIVDENELIAWTTGLFNKRFRTF